MHAVSALSERNLLKGPAMGDTNAPLVCPSTATHTPAETVTYRRLMSPVSSWLEILISTCLEDFVISSVQRRPTQ